MWAIVLSALCMRAALACTPSATTVSGTHAPAAVCSGDLIFDENFDNFDLDKWHHELTLSGGGNWEFQYYNNNRTNSFTRDGNLYIRPSLTSDEFGEDFLRSGTLTVEGCTDPQSWGCERKGTPTHVINPVKSARIRTLNSFNFRYGRLEARAKMPAGDWLWPAIWMMPANDVYGTWPSSGEIDIAESRGNQNKDIQIGTQEVGSTLHFGPYPGLDGWDKAHWSRINTSGYDQDFHLYQLEWTPEFIKFSIDDVELGRVTPGDGGFWEVGEFHSKTSAGNLWKNGAKMAPFDEQFYIIINLAVGGTSGYFPDGVWPSKPWANNSPQALTDFWDGRSSWLPTWKLDVNDGADASLQVDYVRVWAL